MRKLDVAAAVFLTGLSTAVCLASVKLGIGSHRNPGMGFMPFIVSCVLFFLSMGVLVSNIAGKRDAQNKRTQSTRREIKKPAILIIALVGYLFVLNRMGFILATFLLFVAMLSMSEPEKWLKHILVGAIAANASFLVFCKWLQVPLPIGLFP